MAGRTSLYIFCSSACLTLIVLFGLVLRTAQAEGPGAAGPSPNPPPAAPAPNAPPAGVAPPAAQPAPVKPAPAPAPAPTPPPAPAVYPQQQAPQRIVAPPPVLGAPRPVAQPPVAPPVPVAPAPVAQPAASPGPVAPYPAAPAAAGAAAAPQPAPPPPAATPQAPPAPAVYPPQPQQVAQPSAAAAAAAAPEEAKKKEKKRCALGEFCIGPTLTGGFLNVFGVGVIARMEYWGLAFDYQFIDLGYRKVDGHLSMITIEGRVYPFGKWFFLGAGFAWQKASFETRVTIPEQQNFPETNVKARGSVDLPLFKLALGLGGRAGLVFGIDLGLGFRLNRADVKLATDLPVFVRVLPEVAQAEAQFERAAEKWIEWLPFTVQLNVLRVGYLF